MATTPLTVHRVSRRRSLLFSSQGCVSLSTLPIQNWLEAWSLSWSCPAGKNFYVFTIFLGSFLGIYCLKSKIQISLKTKISFFLFFSHVWHFGWISTFFKPLSRWPIKEVNFTWMLQAFDSFLRIASFS